MLHNRASVNAIINKVMSNANGIGESKARAKAESQTKGQNGQAISTKNHSISSTQNMRSVTTQYVNFVKENFSGKALANINVESAKSFIDHKIQEGISLSSINTYISTMGKVADNLNELGHSNINREDITAYRTELKQEFGSLQSIHINRANEDTNSIINGMNQHTPFGLSAELQSQAGLRVDDAINLDKIKINEDNTLHIMGSKNGLDYTTKELNKDLIDRVREAKEEGYQVGYSEYREALKEVVQSTGQEWNGTHSLRYDYAQNEYQEMRENGATDSEALSTISLNMGHSREGITTHYLK